MKRGGPSIEESLDGGTTPKGSGASLHLVLRFMEMKKNAAKSRALLTNESRADLHQRVYAFFFAFSSSAINAAGPPCK